MHLWWFELLTLLSLFSSSAAVACSLESVLPDLNRKLLFRSKAASRSATRPRAGVAAAAGGSSKADMQECVRVAVRLSLSLFSLSKKPLGWAFTARGVFKLHDATQLQRLSRAHKHQHQHNGST
eukprot:15026-Heterococcus_DN1.PRE.1